MCKNKQDNLTVNWELQIAWLYYIYIICILYIYCFSDYVQQISTRNYSELKVLSTSVMVTTNNHGNSHGVIHCILSWYG